MRKISSTPFGRCGTLLILIIFFQKFDIKPLVVRVDYIPERVDLAALSGGKYVELVNLIPWKVLSLIVQPPPMLSKIHKLTT